MVQPGEKEGPFFGDAASITVDLCKTGGRMHAYVTIQVPPSTDQSRLQDASGGMHR